MNSLVNSGLALAKNLSRHAGTVKAKFRTRGNPQVFEVRKAVPPRCFQGQVP